MARDITQLHPRLQKKIEQLKKLCKEEGLNIGIGECFRTVKEQDDLYAKGRTKAGGIVTNAKGSSYQSQHQWGIAFDFFKNVKGHEYDDTKFFNEVGKLAKSIGLGWGGDWTSPVDKPHLYLPDWGSTTTKLKKEYGTFSKFKKTWKEETEKKTETKKKETTTKKKTVVAKDSAKSKLESLKGTYKVTASSLNIRHGAGALKKKMVALPKNTKVKCYGFYTLKSKTKWLYINFTYKDVEYTGFASSKYLKRV